jgi:hypothetical protein
LLGDFLLWEINPTISANRGAKRFWSPKTAMFQKGRKKKKKKKKKDSTAFKVYEDNSCRLSEESSRDHF